MILQRLNKQIIFSFCLLLIPFLHGEEWQTSFEYSQKIMDKDWDFLPEVPPSYDSNNTEAFLFKTDFDRFGIEIETSDFDLDLKRSTEPKDVSLKAKKNSLKFSYIVTDIHKLTFVLTQQDSDEQRFKCYAFANITVGTCESADINIGTSNSKYDRLENNLIGIRGETETLGLELNQIAHSFVDVISLGLYQTNYNYNWLSPIEDIESPFILNLAINGTVLGDAINTNISKLPQREEWKSTQINLRLEKVFELNEVTQLFSSSEFVFIKFNGYEAFQTTPNSNIKFDLGLRLKAGKVDIEVFGEVYKNNLIGFEPITFNQRTEHHFDKTFGQLGLRLRLNI